MALKMAGTAITNHFIWYWWQQKHTFLAIHRTNDGDGVVDFDVAAVISFVSLISDGVNIVAIGGELIEFESGSKIN